MFEFSVSEGMKIIITTIKKKEKEGGSVNPKIASLVKSMLHRKRGGSRHIHV